MKAQNRINAINNRLSEIKTRIEIDDIGSAIQLSRANLRGSVKAHRKMLPEYMQAAVMMAIWFANNPNAFDQFVETDFNKNQNRKYSLQQYVSFAENELRAVLEYMWSVANNDERRDTARYRRALIVLLRRATPVDAIADALKTHGIQALASLYNDVEGKAKAAISSERDDRRTDRNNNSNTITELRDPSGREPLFIQLSFGGIKAEVPWHAILESSLDGRRDVHVAIRARLRGRVIKIVGAPMVTQHKSPEAQGIRRPTDRESPKCNRSKKSVRQVKIAKRSKNARLNRPTSSTNRKGFLR